MQIQPTKPSTKGPAEMFTGDVWFDVIAQGETPSRLRRRIDPGKVFDMTLPLDEVADGYRAMVERRAIKVVLRP